MGRKDKKKEKRRSRSPISSEEESRSKYSKSTKRSPSSSSTDSQNSDSSSSESPERRTQKKSSHRERSSSRDRHTDRSKDSKKKKKRSRSRDRDRSKDRKKKKHRRSRSREKGSSKASSDRQREDNIKQKELMKALETPEEKRARRLAKKEAKERKRMANMGWDEEYAGYTNGDNPFGDEHLLETFRWSKKLEKEGVKNISKEDVERRQKQAMIENRIELEKVKKRRLEREREHEEREKDRERLQREKEAEYFSAWEKQEDTFHLQQAKLRSKIRIEDSRAKPIDLLAQYISPDDEDFTLEMHEPYTCLNGLTITDMEDLLEDIKVYLEMEEGRNADFWRDITIITEDEIEKLRKIDPNTKDFVGERRSGINASVADEVAGFLKVKKLSQLAMLEEKIQEKLRGGEGVDVGYWESFLAQLKAHMARTRLRERHQEQLRAKLFKLKQQQGIESAPLFPIMPGDDTSHSVTSPDNSSRQDAETSAQATSVKEEVDDVMPGTSGTSQPEPPVEAEAGSEEEDDDDEPIITEEDVIEQNYTEYDAGGYSPVYISPNSLDPDTIIYTEVDDAKRLEYARRRSQQTGTAKEDADDMLVKRAREGMNDEEAQFSVEVPLEKQTVLWSDKYRPRKPRFFNRVHTGFEWNKYNQTHYDIDNPPPKIVQGYKFNIFYPDLIDKTKTPEYFLTPCDDNKDFAVLRFHSGPPYEDIAFKIVNREWEYSYKRGFRCQFHNNIFQLWFHFKRYRYRR